MYLFFDTETTWILTDKDRMVQIAWLIFDEKQNLIKKENYIIKPEWYKIPFIASKIHGITTTIANKKWHDLQKGYNGKKCVDEFCK